MSHATDDTPHAASAGNAPDAALITPRGEFRRGMRSIAPTSPGTFAWGLVTGVAMVKFGMTLPQALGMTYLVYAGSAQLAALPLIAAGAPVWVVVLTAIIVNLRFVIYSASLVQIFHHLNLRWRLALGYFTGDVTFAILNRQLQSHPERPHANWFYLGLGIASWIVWQSASVLGIVLASQIPESWGLSLAGAITLVCLTIPLIRNLPAVVGVACAGVLAIVLAHWPARLGLVAAVVVGMSVALALESWMSKRVGKESSS